MESDEETVIRRMVKQFDQIMNHDALARLDAVNLTLHQAVTLASIVEREAQAASERPLIAGVFSPPPGLKSPTRIVRNG